LPLYQDDNDLDQYHGLLRSKQPWRVLIVLRPVLAEAKAEGCTERIRKKTSKVEEKKLKLESAKMNL
jgi:hypothetical protein